MVKISFFERFLLVVCALLAVLIMQGCSSGGGYQFGDISKSIVKTSKNYCTATTPEARAAFKVILNSQGVNIGVDFCTAYTITDMVVNGGNNGT